MSVCCPKPSAAIRPDCAPAGAQRRAKRGEGTGGCRQQQNAEMSGRIAGREGADDVYRKSEVKPIAPGKDSSSRSKGREVRSHRPPCGKAPSLLLSHPSNNTPKSTPCPFPGSKQHTHSTQPQACWLPHHHHTAACTRAHVGSDHSRGVTARPMVLDRIRRSVGASPSRGCRGSLVACRRRGLLSARVMASASRALHRQGTAADVLEL
jgi:hypothetical protein